MGTTTKTGSITAHPTSYDSSHYSYASVSSSHPLTYGETDSDSTTYAQVNWKTGSGAETYVFYIFDFSSIPANATITSVTAKAKGYVSNTSANRVTTRQMQLFTGTSTAKGSALTLSTTASEQTFTTPGSWTRAELQDARIRYYVKRGTSSTTSNYSLRMYGATMTVNYSWQETTYEITVSNSTSVTVTANPAEVIAGESSIIKADSISNITVTDNGTDVTSQFTQQQEQGSYSITNRGSYGFELSNNYYVSQNKGIDKTAAVCRVNFSLPAAATITFTYINYAEQSYDFGVFGNIDTELSTNYYAAGSSGATITDSSYARACNTSSYNSSSTQTLTYNMSAGEHYIDVKYSKDDASSSYNDTLQFQVSITITGTAPTYYGYTISNVQADHTIVVSPAGGGSATIYYKNNGTWIAATTVYKKINGSWVQQTDLTSVFDPSKNYVKGG